MNLITLNPYDNKHKDIVNNSNKQAFKNIMEFPNYYSESQYQYLKNKSNDILEGLISISGNKIKNYCIYSGTKDNRLIQMAIEDLLQKEFLEVSMDYAFSVLDAHTVTIFSDKEISVLEQKGFENLGKEDGIITYIKEKEMELENEIHKRH